MTDDVKPDSDSDLPPTLMIRPISRSIEQQDFMELRRRYRRFAFPATSRLHGLVHHLRDLQQLGP